MIKETHYTGRTSLLRSLFMKKIALLLALVILSPGSLCAAETSAVPSTAVTSSQTAQTETAATFNSTVTRLFGGAFVKKKENGKWWYYRKKNGKLALNGLYRIKGKIYYLDAKGRRRYSWHTVDGTKYYFGKASEGYMYKNRLAKIRGKYYYFQSDGTMAKKCWLTISGKDYYFSKNGYATTGKKKISGTSYTFSRKGVLQSCGPTFSLSADCACLMEVSTGRFLYMKNAYTKHANASTTKIMTAILAQENGSPDDIVTASANAAGQVPTKLYMRAGEKFYLKDLMYSLLVPSHNDTAVAIAEHISGSVSKFVKMMNKKAKSIGCSSTHFCTPNGLDNGLNHYTTARDLAMIARYALGVGEFRTIVSTNNYSFRNLSGKSYSVSTTDELLGTMNGVKGIKTGYTRKAGYCFVGLITSASGKEYISVVLGCPSSASRWADSRKLLSYAYAL